VVAERAAGVSNVGDLYTHIPTRYSWDENKRLVSWEDSGMYVIIGASGTLYIRDQVLRDSMALLLET
jgi:hypothetical protein